MKLEMVLITEHQGGNTYEPNFRLEKERMT